MPTFDEIEKEISENMKKEMDEKHFVECSSQFELDLFWKTFGLEI